MAILGVPSNEGTGDPDIGKADADGAEGLWNAANPETTAPDTNFIVGAAVGSAPGVPA